MRRSTRQRTSGEIDGRLLSNESEEGSEGNTMNFKKASGVFLIILLGACSAGKIEPVAPSPAASATPTDVIVPSQTRPPLPTKTPSPTLQPTETIPAATSNAIETTEAIR